MGETCLLLANLAEAQEQYMDTEKGFVARTYDEIAEFITGDCGFFNAKWRDVDFECSKWQEGAGGVEACELNQVSIRVWLLLTGEK